MQAATVQLKMMPSLNNGQTYNDNVMKSLATSIDG